MVCDRRLTRLDVVVNNAGYGKDGTVEETDPQAIQNIFNVNVLATIKVVKATLPTFRTQRSGYFINIGSVASLGIAESTIEGYENVRKTKERYLSMDGRQPGDPERAAEIFIQLAENPEPPIHLFLGKDAYTRVRAKLDAMSESLEKWKPTTIGAEFPN